MQEMIKQIIREEMARSYKKYYFIAGFPRSGSTLLSAILNQNPKFYSGPNSPVVSIMAQLEQIISQDEMFNSFPKPAQANLIIGSVINNWYRDIEKQVIFDKNRSWTSHIPFINGYLDTKPKIIYPVRNVDEILSSFIEMFKRNPTVNSQGRLNIFDNILVRSGVAINDDNRCTFIAGPNGILGQAYSSLRAVYENGQDSVVHLVEYDDLVNNPHETMNKIYDFLEEERFEHTFDNIKNDYRELDEQFYGLSDMHEVRPSLNKREINPKEILPEHIYNMCQNMEFWRKVDELEDDSSNSADVPTSNDEDDTKLIGAKNGEND